MAKLPMLRAVHLLVLLWGMDTARGDVTQDAKEEVWGSFVSFGGT